MTRAHDTNRVRLRREEMGMLLKELAQKIGRSAGLLSHVERGFVPKRPTQVQIAAALNTTPEALWPEEYEPPDPNDWFAREHARLDAERRAQRGAER